MRVFVHGVPETAEIWSALRTELPDESIAVELPGFGCPRPDGFDASKEAYAVWLADEVTSIAERTGEPVDLVGHDWGAGFTLRLALQAHPALRSWAVDVAGLMHPDYVWHDTAQLWRTPTEGEAVIDVMVAAGAELGPTYEGFGLEPGDAADVAGWMDAEMGACILALYRSATPNVHADWGPLTATATPGLVIHATGDSFSDGALGAEVAAATGAHVEQLTDAGHFWPRECPADGAALLGRFWSSLG